MSVIADRTSHHRRFRRRSQAGLIALELIVKRLDRNAENFRRVYLVAAGGPERLKQKLSVDGAQGHARVYIQHLARLERFFAVIIALPRAAQSRPNLPKFCPSEKAKLFDESENPDFTGTHGAVGAPAGNRTRT